MGRSRILLTLAVACVLALVVPPVSAFGAPASKSATPTAPLASGPIDGQVWPAQDGQQTTVIVDVALDPSVKLPARVRIPVPKGATVLWAGEILSGEASADQEREYTLHDGPGGGRYAEFTLSVSHRGQIDTSGIPMTLKGNAASTQVDWIQSVPSTSTLFTVRLPAGVSDVRIDPAPEGAPETNSAGEELYVLPSQALATGATFSVKVAYNTSPTGAAASSASNLTPLYIVLIVLLLAAFAAVAYLFSRQRAPSGGGDTDDPQDAEFAEEQAAGGAKDEESDARPDLQDDEATGDAADDAEHSRGRRR